MIFLVERQVVSQLALAHETEQLSRDCVVRLYTDTSHKETGDMLRSEYQEYQPPVS